MRSSLSLSASIGTMSPMPEDKVWTAAELERMTPDERDRVVRAGFVSDLSTLSPEFAARVRDKGRRLLEERCVISRAGDAD